MAALQLGHLAVVELVRNVKTLEQHGSVGLGLVAVFIADGAFEFAETGPVFVGHFGLVVDHFALFKGGPESFVAHDHGIDDAVGVKRILILGEDTDLLGADNSAFLWVDLAGEHLHEGRFAGTVGASEAVAAARGEGDGHVFEQELRAVSHGYVGSRNHWISPILQGGGGSASCKPAVVSPLR